MPIADSPQEHERHQPQSVVRGMKAEAREDRAAPEQTELRPLTRCPCPYRPGSMDRVATPQRVGLLSETRTALTASVSSRRTHQAALSRRGTPWGATKSSTAFHG